MAKKAMLQGIENNRNITKETDSEFLYALQSGLLLALKERGRLDEMQFRHAERALREQQRACIKQPQKTRGSV